MGKNIIYTFSGTGNSLWAAQEISRALQNCAVATMASGGERHLAGGYDRIGFVYPTYYRGIPARVRRFVAALDLEANRGAYFYAIATCGNPARAGNSLVQLRNLLARKGIELAYAAPLKMFSNYVLMYEMKDNAAAQAAQAADELKPLIESIAGRAGRRDQARTKLAAQLAYQAYMRLAPQLDKGFRVSDACSKCGICQKVCPVANIACGKDGKPLFQHHCEQCLACLHNCPAKAIDYKDRTPNRGRYIHPAVTWRQLAELNSEPRKT